MEFELNNSIFILLLKNRVGKTKTLLQFKFSINHSFVARTREQAVLHNTSNPDIKITDNSF